MMKLTVAFLATLAAADASNNMRHRHVRRQGYGYGPGPAVPAANSTVATSSTSLTSPSPVALTSTDVSPEKPTNPTGPGNVPTYGDGKPSPSVPGVSFPGTGTMPGTAPATEVATPLPTTTTSLSPVEGGNTTSSSPFPTFHITGTDGTFPTAVPSGISPTGTGPAGENSVTVTITSYQVFTSTMCPEGVANCAGTAKTTKLITSAVPIGTTVCDKSKASSIIASGLHSTPASATGTATDTSVGAVGTPVPSTVVEHETKTLTATVGTGENAHLTTYTVTNKITRTEYVTAGPSASQNGEAPTPEPTTTLTTDITSTIGVTMTVTEGLPGAPTGGNGYPAGPKPSGVPVTPEGSQAPGEGECAPPVTVTVTAKETVTVTEGSSTGTAVPDDVPSHETSTGATGPSGKPTGVPHHTKPSHSEKPSGMPTGAPYPIGNGNGTVPVIPGSTGFVTSTKPSGPRPTGELPGYGSGPAPSGSSSSAALPTFVLPSATPAGQPATETSTSPEAPAPVESGAYGPGYGYGSKKRGFLGLF